jgi:STE24 endopeptidase
MDKSVLSSPQEKARQYSRIKYSLIIGETGLFLAFCFLWQSGGISTRLASVIYLLCGNASPFVSGPVYLTIFGFVYYIISFPAVFYHTFLLEHQFGLSRESMKNWFIDQAKSGAISYTLSCACFLGFYWVLAAYPSSWWIPLAFGWIVLGIVLAYLTPVAIVPMFYKYERLPDGALRARLIVLANSMGIRLLDVYHIDFSKRTAKANAALIGLGSSKRVILSDTLRAAFTSEEIVVIAAHEFAHFRCGHTMKLMLASACISLGFFYAGFHTYKTFLAWWGLSSLADPACIPLIFLYIACMGLISTPAMNALCRRFESAADKAAIQATGSVAAFISAMEKLADQNLLDRDPPAVFVWLFHSHPPVSERIARARLLAS